MKKLLILPLLLLTACGEESTIKHTVRSMLVDPASAKFGDITVVPLKEGKAACVTVNAKNSYGGYTGDQQVLVVETPSGWMTDGDGSEISHKTCVDILKDSRK